jgi:hypothetical protein
VATPSGHTTEGCCHRPALAFCSPADRITPIDEESGAQPDWRDALQSWAMRRRYNHCRRKGGRDEYVEDLCFHHVLAGSCQSSFHFTNKVGCLEAVMSSKGGVDLLPSRGRNPIADKLFGSGVTRS